MSEIRFYRATGEYGFLSNLYPCEVYLTGEGHYRSAEHAYQVGKAKSPAMKADIRGVKLPRTAAIIGHGLYPFDVVEHWNAIKLDRMQRVVWAKFDPVCHDPLHTSYCNMHRLGWKLLATGEAILVEASKTDAFWGIGRNGDGANMLGSILMETRKKIVESKAQQ
jgi:ribA/ribD-fused uncharacterized protein